MDDDYFSIDAILAENQVNENTGRLLVKLTLLRKFNALLSKGFKEWGISVEALNGMQVARLAISTGLMPSTDTAKRQNADSIVASLHSDLFVRALPVDGACTDVGSDWVKFDIPPPFGHRVRNALRAEATSVRLASLVGTGGLWYGFGKTIMDM